MKTLTDDDVAVLNTAIETYGPLSQLGIVAEECLEMIEQLDEMLSHVTRAGKLGTTYGEADRTNFYDEAADVYVVCQEFLLIYGTDAMQEWHSAYIETGMSFDDGLDDRVIASVTMSMLVKVAINALKLQREEYTPDLHWRWESGARGFGIAQYFIEALATRMGDKGHTRINAVVDAKLARLADRMSREVPRDRP